MQFEDFISQLYITTNWTCRDLFPLDLGPVVQRANNVTQRIHCYPVDESTLISSRQFFLLQLALKLYEKCYRNKKKNCSRLADSEFPH